MSDLRSDWLITRSGVRFVIGAPTAEMVNVLDIAGALSRTCRFGGHTTHHYSVAQHSVLVADIVAEHTGPALVMHALLHDAAEAYIGDVIRPLKRLLPEYKVIEARVEEAICDAFGLRPLTPLEHDVVKSADLIALATERRDFMPAAWALRESFRWAEDESAVKPLRARIVPLEAAEAESAFLKRYASLRAVNS